MNPIDPDLLTERLIEWSNLNSGSRHLPGLERMAAVLRSACLELSPETGTIRVSPDGRAAIRARRRPEAPVQVLLAAHYDTVYEAAHPFQRCRREGAERLVGPGVADMKGGIVLLLAALARFEQTGPRRVGWEVLLTPDEEIGSADSLPLLREAAGRCHLGLVFEPGRDNGDLVSGRMGTGWARVLSRGRAGHAAALPQKGRNAIAALCEFLGAIGQLPAEMPGLMLNIGRIEGGGPTNVVPDFAEAEIDVRIGRPETAPALQARLAELAAPINAQEGHRLEIDLGFTRPPWNSGPGCAPLFQAWRQCFRDRGLAAPGLQEVGGGSDANLLAAEGLPCLDGLGPIGGRYHSPEEWIDLPSLPERAEVAALFLRRIEEEAVRLPRP